MDIKTLLLIFLWTFIGVLFIAIIVLTFLYGRLTIKDNPKRALIFLKTGNHISRPIKGHIVGKPSYQGTRFNYLDKTIFVPHKYGDYFHLNKRMLFVNHIGQLVPMPFSNDLLLSNDEKAELIYELCASHIGGDSIRALKGKQTMSIFIVGIIAFIFGILVMFAYNYMQDATTQTPSQPTTQQSQPTQQQPVEVR